MYSQILIVISLISFLYFCFKRGLIYHRYFQQEEYDWTRFFRWILQNKAFDKRGALVLFVSWVTYTVFKSPLECAYFVSILFFFIFGYQQKDPRVHGKIRLKMTARASRIFYLACFIFVAILACLLLPCFTCHLDSKPELNSTFLILFLLVQVLPVFIVLANLLLAPLEKYTKQKYINEAKAILKDVNPYVIGITGSYGKTSVKAALGEVLNAALAPTFSPPKSINTVMGITREIRENMKPHHEYAVIEMGAYNVGSIKRLCDFTPPHAGIITVVGMAHLERYGTVERVYIAKSELAQAVPVSGIFVANGDNEGARKMSQEHPHEKTYLYGMKPELGALDCVATDIESTLRGTDFKLQWKDRSLSGFTKLHGTPALSNLLSVFTTACALGADPEHVLAAIRNIEPVDNRLSLEKEGEIYFLRDAYNSNPAGFDAALDVLMSLPAKRKILMTPGMIELGTEQFSQNKKVAQKAAACCDVVILVGDTNREALLTGLREGGIKEEAIVFCRTRELAFKELSSRTRPEDLVLIENDLPDLYEVEEVF